MSALTGSGFDTLLAVLGDRLAGTTATVDLLVPFERGDVLARVHREGEVVEERATEGGMAVRARLDETAVGHLTPYLVSP